MNIHDAITNIDQDKLNARSLAKIMINRLTDEDCPSTLGLYGGWGTGKTSTLNLLIELNQLAQYNSHPYEFSNPPQIAAQANKLNSLLKGVVETAHPAELPRRLDTFALSKSLHIEVIDAWQYDSTDNLLTPVIVRLMRSLKGLDAARFTNWKKYAERIIEVTSLALSEIALKKLTGISLGDVRGYIDASEKHVSVLGWEQTIDHIEETNEAFCELVRIFLTHHQSDKLVLCIDNLDRCSPENVVQLLESIKNFLAVKDCTWVFVMDNNLISSYINRKYEGTNMDGNSYLDKIIPEQYHVIQPTGEQAIELLQGLLFQDIRLGNYAQISRFLVPRRLIKTAVKYAQAMRLAQLSKESRKELLFALILLYHGWPDFYEFLSSGSDEHITGTMQNFYSKFGDSKKHPQKVPIPEVFESDKELIYYIQTALYQNLRVNNLLSEENALSAHFEKLRYLIRMLRFAGLP